MKPFFICAFICLISLKTFAQLSNTSFETWAIETGSFGYPPFLPIDTFDFSNPTGWTSSNSATAHDSLENKILTTQSSDAIFGSSSVRMETDSVRVLGVGVSIVVPGFVVNGKFKLNLTTLLQAGGEVSPATLNGAGSPLTTRKEKLGVYIKYAPVPNDSLVIWAVLKKSGQIIAQAKFNSTQAYPQFTYIEVPFVYESCETPDSIAILISPSTPDFSLIGGSTTGLVIGSVLFADSVTLIDFTTIPNFPPIAKKDVFNTFKNTTADINVLVNDEDCEGSLTLTAITQAPKKGTATINNGKITYTPNNNYIGRDTLYYRITDNANQIAEAFVDISVFNVSGIKEINQISFKLNPNPSKGFISIEAQERIDAVKLYDVTGKLVDEYIVDLKLRTIKIDNIKNGIYIVLVKTENGIGTKRLIVE
jgi:hypothetical protein